MFTEAEQRQHRLQLADYLEQLQDNQYNHFHFYNENSKSGCGLGYAAYYRMGDLELKKAKKGPNMDIIIHNYKGKLVDYAIEFFGESAAYSFFDLYRNRQGAIFDLRS